jgi:hypothetical protein
MMERHTRCILQAPETTIMNKRTTLLTLLLLIVTVSVSAQSLPTGSENAQAGPLNLSLPKKAMQVKAAASAAEKTDGTAAGQPEAVEVSGKKNEESSALRLPYGAGFENRQQGMASGGGGRGGKGRGR